MAYLWELRYRGAMSVDNVLIETVTDREEEAIELGQAYLDSLATQNVRFVRVRKIVVDRTVDHAGLRHKWSRVPVKVAPVVVVDDMAPPVQAAPVSPPPGQPATRGNAGKSAIPVRARAKPAPTAKAKVPVVQGTDPPPEPEGPRVQTHNRDVRSEARQRVMNATRTGRVTRLGE